VERARSRDRAKLASYLLQSIIARHRDRWADVVLRTALWMREAPAEADLCWRELAIVAKALAEGRDMTEIGLMRDIALRTIAVLDDPRRM
jgi:DNA-binding NarL/FixJ family response regulator